MRLSHMLFILVSGQSSAGCLPQKSAPWRKGNILLGETVIQADIMEDRCAGEDQVAITKEVYNGLKAEDAKLAECFKGTGDYFVATISYEKYSREVAYRQQQNNTVRNHYNGAWGDLV